MSMPAPEADSGDYSDYPDENAVFHQVHLRVLDASSDDITMLEEVIDDAVNQIRRLCVALVCNEPLAKLSALASAEDWLAQFAAPVPLDD